MKVKCLTCTQEQDTTAAQCHPYMYIHTARILLKGSRSRKEAFLFKNAIVVVRHDNKK